MKPDDRKNAYGPWFGKDSGAQKLNQVDQDSQCRWEFYHSCSLCVAFEDSAYHADDEWVVRRPSDS